MLYLTTSKTRKIQGDVDYLFDPKKVLMVLMTTLMLALWLANYQNFQIRKNNTEYFFVVNDFSLKVNVQSTNYVNSISVATYNPNIASWHASN
jgi:hypothetical protein